MLQKKLKKLEDERKEAEATEKEREAELVRLKLMVAEAEKVGATTLAHPLVTRSLQRLANSQVARLEFVVAEAEKARATLPAYPSNGQIASGCMQEALALLQITGTIWHTAAHAGM